MTRLSQVSHPIYYLLPWTDLIVEVLAVTFPLSEKVMCNLRFVQLPKKSLRRRKMSRNLLAMSPHTKIEINKFWRLLHFVCNAKFLKITIWLIWLFFKILELIPFEVLVSFQLHSLTHINIVLFIVFKFTRSILFNVKGELYWTFNLATEKSKSS